MRTCTFTQTHVRTYSCILRLWMCLNRKESYTFSHQKIVKMEKMQENEITKELRTYRQFSFMQHNFSVSTEL